MSTKQPANSTCTVLQHRFAHEPGPQFPRQQRTLGHQGVEQSLFHAGRAEINKRRRRLEDTRLETALDYFFGSILVVQSYLCSKDVADPHAGEQGMLIDHRVCVLGLDEALFAADQAVRHVRDEREREVVYAASLMFPCGHFIIAHPLAQPDTAARRRISDEVLRHRKHSLELPLSWLRQVDQELGRKMAYLLEQLDEGEQGVVSPEWTPLRDVVLRSQVRIRSFWLGGGEPSVALLARPDA